MGVMLMRRLGYELITSLDIACSKSQVKIIRINNSGAYNGILRIIASIMKRPH